MADPFDLDALRAAQEHGPAIIEAPDGTRWVVMSEDEYMSLRTRAEAGHEPDLARAWTREADLLSESDRDV